MTIQDILKIEFPSNFGSDEDGEETPVMEEVYNQLDSSVETAYGASKFVIFLNNKEVVKVPFSGCYWWDEDAEDHYRFDEFMNTDYCATEAAVYADAVALGVEKFFASMKYRGTAKGGTPIYLAERVYTYYDNGAVRERTDSFSKRSQEIADEMKDNYNIRIHREWLARAIEYYGEDAVNDLLAFIELEGINDFHTENIGFREDGSPVILDYSGYRE